MLHSQAGGRLIGCNRLSHAFSLAFLGGLLYPPAARPRAKLPFGRLFHQAHQLALLLLGQRVPLEQYFGQ